MVDTSHCVGRFDRRHFLLAAAATGLWLPEPSTAWCAQAVGSVEDVKGHAVAGVNGRQRDLERASPLFVRDEVSTATNSRLTLHLGQDTTVRLGETARLVIDRFLVDAGGEITLGSGPMLFSRPEGKLPLSVQVRSAYGLIAVRGTRFFAGPSNSVFGVFVERGAVRVSAAGRSVTVRTGEGTNIARPGARPTRPAPWGAARIKAALDSVN
jgi:ferric-dicitrate binding protein FerR (iron transport regulator)